MSTFSARIYWLEWKILKKLPDNYLFKTASLLHFKFPTPPPLLAGSLLIAAGEIGEKLVNTLGVNEELITPAEAEEKKFDLLGELLRAFYCLAVAFLRADEFAQDPTEYKLYMIETYQQLRNLIPENALRIFSNKMMGDASLFYLNDEPPLAEYAETMRDYCLVEEMENVNNRGWFGRFVFKVNIRVAAALDISTSRLEEHLTLTIAVASQLSSYAKLFARMRPVPRDPTYSGLTTDCFPLSPIIVESHVVPPQKRV